MPGTDDSPGGSGRRWWEIRGRRESDSGGDGHLITGTRGRTRPERSLSVGADPVIDEPNNRWRGFMWPIASLVAVGALIVGGVYALPKLISSSTDSDASPVAHAQQSPQDDGARRTVVVRPPTGDRSGGGARGVLPPLTGFGGMPGDYGTAPGGSGAVPGGAGSMPGAGSDSDGSPAAEGADGGSSESSDNGSGPKTTAIELDGPAPDAPGRQQGGEPVAGSGGCNDHQCTVTQRAPVYSAGSSKPRLHAPARQYPFLCQSDGSSYSVGDRSSDWWAWVGNGRVGAWIPTLFLDGAPENDPVPGLPVCGSGTKSSTETSSTPSNRSNPSASATTTKSATAGQ